MSTSISNNLNSEQKKAVEHTEGPSVILAGAGSGKTRVLVHKVKYLVEEAGVPPYQILMITFTNKAAAEMKERIAKSVNLETHLGYVGTFHAFCARLMRIHADLLGYTQKFVIYDDGDQLAILRKIIKSKLTTSYSPSYFLHRISNAKNEMIGPNKYLEVFSDHQAKDVQKIYDLYQKELKKNNAVDFDDLLVKTIELLSFHPEVLEKYQNRYRYILVDEFQDTNLAQYVITRMLGEKYKNVTIVGDFSQSIYSFRGADIQNLEKFQKDFPKSVVFHLEQNYRSSQNILNFAFQIISKNKTHPILELMSENVHGDLVEFFEAEGEQEEALYLVNEMDRLQDKYPYSSFAVLYRTNAQSRTIEEAFLHRGVPYVLVGGTRFYERKEVKDILSYLRLLVNPSDEVSKDRALKIGKRKFEGFKNLLQEIKDTYQDMTTEAIMERVFDATKYLELYHVDDPEDFNRLENVKELKSVAVSYPDLVQFLEQIALVESEYSEGEKRGIKDGVKLMTLHQAKGLEFDCVFIVGVEEGILPHSRSTDDYFQLEEERRLFYVGITRARKKLYITHAKRRFIFGRRGEALKSRFLFENEEYTSY